VKAEEERQEGGATKQAARKFPIRKIRSVHHVGEKRSDPKKRRSRKQIANIGAREACGRRNR